MTHVASRARRRAAGTVILPLLVFFTAGAAEAQEIALSDGNTAWIMTATALVLFMTLPGLALFYGGMVRRKNVLTTMMHSFVAMAIIGVQWITVGYAIAFGKSHFGLFGWSWDAVGLHGIEPSRLYGDKGIPELVFVMFQGKFAIITPALIAGAFAERVRFRGYCAFITLWVLLVYIPLCHWVWAELPCPQSR